MQTLITLFFQKKIIMKLCDKFRIMDKILEVKSIKLLNRILKKIVAIETIASMILFMIVVFLYSFDIVRRMIVNKSVAWIPHTGLMIYVWVIFIGIGPLFYKGEEIRVEYFVNLLPKNIHRIIRLLAYVFDIIFFSIVLYFIPKLISLQTRLDVVLPVPRYFYSLPLIISGLTVILAEINSILHFIVLNNNHH